jgi:hypothetical protein
MQSSSANKPYHVLSKNMITYEDLHGSGRGVFFGRGGLGDIYVLGQPIDLPIPVIRDDVYLYEPEQRPSELQAELILEYLYPSSGHPGSLHASIRLG